MHRPLITADSIRLSGLIGLVVLLCSCLIGTSALAELQEQDIEALRQQGIDEGWTFEVRMNPACEYSLDELCGLEEPENWREGAKFNAFEEKRDIPSAFDWRDKVLPPVRSQGGCGACWAFGSVGPLECNIKIKDGVVVDLSEQWLVSCNTNGYDCDGGWWVHDYHEWKGDPCGGTGAVLEEYFPYTATNGSCNCPYPHDYFIDDWAYIGGQWQTPSVDAMKQAIMEYGPISVGVSVNDAFQAYGSGVFNGCENGSVNHAVTLVGWDDDDGDYGCWILRNSWGPYWGEGGYMRIPYGCSRVGYNACYVDFDGGVDFTVDTTFGWAPMEVNFEATSGYEVDVWSWDFGDGTGSNLQSPSHLYDTPGMFDVTVEIDAEGEVFSRNRPNCVVVLADSLIPESVVGKSDTTVELRIRARNNAPVQYFEIPVVFDGELNVSLDSFSTEGCRTDYFGTQSFVSWDPNHHRKAIQLLSSIDNPTLHLPPGEGDIIRIFFSIPAGARAEQIATIDLTGYLAYSPTFSWPLFEYAPIVTEATISVASCCVGLAGNVDNDPADGCDISDLTALVNHLFVTFETLPCAEEANTNGTPDGTVDISDLTLLVNHLFVTFESLATCQ